jgi:hypothetical protein
MLSKKYNLINRNFSVGGSSNQKQERLAMQYFSSELFKKDQNIFDQIIVLWGITSTNRNEMFMLEKNNLDNFFLTDGTVLSKNLLKLCYSHDFEVWFLAQKMNFWNFLLKNLNIKNLWFDTFNHHDYSVMHSGYETMETKYNEFAGDDWPEWKLFCTDPTSITNIPKKIYEEIVDVQRWDFWQYRIPSIQDLNLLFADRNPRDLLSLLSIVNLDEFQSCDNNYHYSDWKIDTNRVDYLVDKDILNPYSFHPTKQGHLQISNILSSSLESLLK